MNSAARIRTPCFLDSIIRAVKGRFRGLKKEFQPLKDRYWPLPSAGAGVAFSPPPDDDAEAEGSAEEDEPDSAAGEGGAVSAAGDELAVAAGSLEEGEADSDAAGEELSEPCDADWLVSLIISEAVFLLAGAAACFAAVFLPKRDFADGFMVFFELDFAGGVLTFGSSTGAGAAGGRASSAVLRLSTRTESASMRPLN